MDNKKIIFLEPVLDEKIWGSDFFQKNGFKTKSQKVGEALIVSALKHKSSTLRDTKETLYNFYNDEKNKWFFNFYDGEYPLLTKIIHAEQDLSIQVHPDDEYAKEHFEKLGKNEAWYILDCPKNSSIIYGNPDLSKEKLQKHIENGEWDKILKNQPVKPDDIVYVPAGTIHAIKKNILIYEIQQSSDLTFRLYDYDRLENGKLRDLHLTDALNVINCSSDNASQETFPDVHFLLKNKFFKLKKYIITSHVKIHIPEAQWLEITVINGKGFVNDLPIKKYDVFLVAHNTPLSFHGTLAILVGYF